MLLLALFGVLMVVTVNAVPPTAVELSPEQNNLEFLPTLARVARANQPEPKKDLEGSESAYIAYPYVYPYFHHYPYVVVGK